MTTIRRAHFVTELDVRELGGGRRQVLEPLLFYSVELAGYVAAPARVIVNYADIPRPFWSLFRPDGPWMLPSVLHDCALRGELVTLMGQPLHLIAALAHQLFREAMSTVPEISDVTRELMYRCVRRFGGRPYGGLGTAA
jgi:hypothetical protein